MKNEINHPNPLPAIPSSEDVAGIELRMLPPYIRDNHTLQLRPFFPGRAKLYCLTLVVSDAANQLYGLMDLNAFPRVGRNEYLPINKTIFYWEAGNGAKAPNQVHVMCSVIKSKESLREAGQVLEQAKEDGEYQHLVSQLSALDGDVSLAAVSQLTLQIAGVVGRYLGRVEDHPLGTVVQSFTRLHGDWDRLGITPIATGTQDVDFAFDLVIRDRERSIPPPESEGTAEAAHHAEQYNTIPAMLPL
jgi:hypothetical protein